MKILHLDSEGQTLYGESLQAARRVIALGFFDGVHRGHMDLIQLALVRAAELRAEHPGVPSTLACVYTFDRKQGLSNETQTLLQSEDERAQVLMKLGLDELLIQQFDTRLMHLCAQDFLQQFLNSDLGIQHIIVGENFRFGHQREAGVEQLKAFCASHQIGLDILPLFHMGGEPVSSSRIRQLIQEGQLERASELLGYAYSFKGTVIHGKALARRLGIPTANMLPSKEKVLPPNGVYLSRSRIGSRVYASITHLGYRPTVDDPAKSAQPILETFVYDFDQNVYGDEIEISLLSFRRPEEKFPSLLSMTEQMRRDLEECQKLHERRDTLDETYHQKGFNCYRLHTDRFRRENLDLLFYLPLSEVKRSAMSILAACMSSANALAPNPTDWAKRLEDRYGASVSVSTDLMGDVMVLRYSISALSQVHQDRPFYECIRELKETLLCLPRDASGQIEASLFEREKQQLILSLRQKQAEPQWLAVQGAVELALAHESCALDPEGSYEEALEVTREDLDRLIETIQKRARRRLVISGPIREDETQLLRDFVECTTGPEKPFDLKPANHPKLMSAKLGLEARVSYPTDLSHLVILWTHLPAYCLKNQWQSYFLAEYLGGDGSALLFTRLREERGLTYALDAFVEPYLNLLGFRVSLQEEHIEEAKALLRSAILEVARGDVDEALFEATKSRMKLPLETLTDELDECVGHALEELFTGRRMSRQEYVEALERFSVADLKKVAENLKESVCYVLEGKARALEEESEGSHETV